MVRYRASRQHCAARHKGLQLAMRKGTQRREDFADAAALWGYVAAKFTERAA